jgi:hypothetical protein
MPYSLHPYQYAYSNPLTYTDPTGKWSNDCLSQPWKLECILNDPWSFLGNEGFLEEAEQAGQQIDSRLDDTQTGLDIVGLAPGPAEPIAMIADGANASISALRGDWEGAGLSCVALIPGFGLGATAGKGVLRHGDDVADLGLPHNVRTMYDGPGPGYGRHADDAVQPEDEAAQGWWASVSSTGSHTRIATKAEARSILVQMGLPDEQYAAANRAIGRGTVSSTYDVLKVNEQVIVRVQRPGRNGYQSVESVVYPDGTKTVIQRAYDADGNLVHNDPKTP